MFMPQASVHRMRRREYFEEHCVGEKPTLTLWPAGFPFVGKVKSAAANVGMVTVDVIFF
jgi:hypothetical protein